MESRAHSAEQQAEEARARVADAQASADRARATAEEARHGIGAISTKLARVEAERRLHEQAERRLESRCAELKSARVEREEKTAIVEHFDRRLATIEEAAEAAANRVAAAERELIKGSRRPWFDGGDRVERADRVRTAAPWRRSNPASAATSPKGTDARVARPSVGQPSRAVKGRLTPLARTSAARPKGRIRSAASAHAGARRTPGRLGGRAPGSPPFASASTVASTDAASASRLYPPSRQTRTGAPSSEARAPIVAAISP